MMPEGWWPVLIVVGIAAFVVYIVAKIRVYQRLSERQWEETDKSKLKEWDDDDDW